MFRPRTLCPHPSGYQIIQFPHPGIHLATALDRRQLWARNPEFLKNIVYRMRFDEASARYAEFGPFYTSYITSAEEMLRHCRLLD